MDCVLLVGSDASLVAVEGRDMKHVAVCADPDGFHLTISGQRSRMGGAARAKDLKRHSIILAAIHIKQTDNARVRFII